MTTDICKPDQQESAFQIELSRITAIARDDALSGLNAMINLLQGINMELLQAYAPPLIVAAQTHTAFTRHEIKAIACLVNLQEAITKLGMAEVKVKDAIKRRVSKSG